MAPSPDEVRAWLRENWDISITLAEWWRRLYEAGYAFPAWPVGLGGLGLSADDAPVIGRELGRARAIAPPGSVGSGLGGGTLLVHGTPGQQARLLPGLGRGEEAWVQLFSEPGAGSDLAGLATRAVPAEGGFIVNGQKVWSSGGMTADRGMLLARTDVDVPKHQGITYFIIDIDQPGVEVRPLRQMSGEAHFCEVFLTDAFVPADRVIGAVGGGWQVARTTLTLERGGLAEAGVPGLVAVETGRKSGNLDRVVSDILRDPASARRPATSFFFSPEQMASMATRRGLGGDPVIRDAVVDYYIEAEVSRLTAQRVKAAVTQGQAPGPGASTMKLAMSEHGRHFRDLMLTVLGPEALFVDDGAPEHGRAHATFYWSFAGTIGGGTDEIQRNVIAEQVLGLPREQDVSRNVPYRDLKVGTQNR